LGEGDFLFLGRTPYDKGRCSIIVTFAEEKKKATGRGGYYLKGFVVGTTQKTGGGNIFFTWSKGARQNRGKEIGWKGKESCKGRRRKMGN